MLRKIIYITICPIIFPLFLYSQKITISGYISDDKTGESLINANVIDSIGQNGSASNKFGFYTIQLKQNTTYYLKYSYVGYKSIIIKFIAYTDSIINVKLTSGTLLDQINIIYSNGKKLEEKAEISKVNIPIDKIKLLPNITGEPDILKAYQLLPGIQSGSEGNNGLYVRGGTPDENLFLLDDVPLYNVSHLGGLFSVFDPSMVKSIDLYKGGFPARYGGRISSVVDIRNKEGNLNSFDGEIGFSFLLTKIFIEGPIKKNKASFAFSVRRCNLDVYSFLFNNLTSNPSIPGYTFYDINFKANYKFSQTDRLFLSLYYGRDDYYYTENTTNEGIKSYGLSDLKWGNSAASMRWLHILNNKIFNNLTFGYTKYVYENNNLFTSTNLTDNSALTDQYQIQSSISNLLIKSDIEIPINQNSIKFGGMFSKNIYIPSYTSYSQKLSFHGVDSMLVSPAPPSTLNSSEFYAYTEFNYNITQKISGNIGFRAGYYLVDSSKYSFFEPRIIINYMFLPSYSIKVSYCNMDQTIHLLTNSGTGLPSDIWVPSTSIIKPEVSHQITIGFVHTTLKEIEFVIEAYYKTENNLIEYKDGALIFDNLGSWENRVDYGGTGKIKGIEFLATKKTGKLTGWIGYTLSDNTRNFKDLNNGNDYPFKYDERHNISIVGNYMFSKKFFLSATWVYHTGDAITLPSEKYVLINANYYYASNPIDNSVIYNDVYIYSEKNGYRMPDYHRLDIGLNYTKLKRHGISIWTIGVYNAYNRQNAYYLYFKPTSNGQLGLYQQSLFPILINFGYTFKF